MRTPADEALTSFVTGLLGEHTWLADWSQPHQLSRVLAVVDDSGRRWVVKQHSQPDDWAREVRAYRRWVPALAPHAPELLGASRARLALVVTAVAGEVGPNDAAAHRAAGAVLRRLHERVAVEDAPDFGAKRAAELEQQLSQGRAVLDGPERRFLAAEVAGWQEPTGPLVACHFDFAPRNWLRDADDGHLSVIDFAGARRHLWTQDLVRLHLGAWQGADELRDAFLDGYGRQLDETDETRLRRCAITTAARMVVGARIRQWHEHAALWTRNLHALMSGER